MTPRSTKTAGSKRDIYLGNNGMSILKDQQKFQELQRQHLLQHDKEWHETGLIFSSTIGTPMEPTVLRRAFKRFLLKAGLSLEFHFHDLRHTSISLMASRKVGANLKNIQNRTGQRNEKVTNRYTYTLEEDDRQIAKLLEEILHPQSSSIEDQDPNFSNEPHSSKPDDENMQQNCSGSEQ